ncbi:Bug family tripartite tricarboxylate transporter substrate binding protein [Aquabacter spiritensis]|uniref:Tripartite-type tricarboxylate transporter receptor subunit TctC n=1 Tax=Aquabacter spiritensis TaxID=933073 RepID=A0A4R3LUR8_9HYPH|nr:tripartite tricarboxylate transporter substrate binding protein [Aquabacter spiritensis]TCT04271.1 tripartite-type tricarboxylate transporter receptor subunit TctC [Aquabacter spiritensis]
MKRLATFAAGCALAFALGASLLPAAAQTAYPTRPVRIIVPFGAGGIADITVRVVAEKLTEKLGQQFVIENQPGAGGITAARAAIQGGTDGYTLALLSNGTAISVPLFKKLPFDPVKDFTPVSSLGYFDFLFLTNGASKYKSVAELVAFAKANAGALNVGTVNVGSSQNLSAELFKSMAGIDFTIIPYKGTPDLVLATTRNDVDLMIDSYASAKAMLADKKIRALASSGLTRSPVLPDLVTVDESGVKGFEVTSWNAIFAPAGTSKEIVATLNSAIRDVLAMPDVKKRLLELGIEAKASTPQELEDRLTSDIAKWSAVITKANIEKQ